MISYDFAYYRPASIQEAVQTFQALRAQGKHPLYYGGGTEIITLARINYLCTDAVIDLKEIPECNTHGFHQQQLVTGSTLSLTQVSEANLFPLLSKAASGAADHTARNKITLGGNITGNIFYREAVLPFLLAESQAVLAGEKGVRFAPLLHIFDQRLQLEAGEFLVQLITDRLYTELPHVHIRKLRIGKVGYPLVTVAALKKDNQIRTAFSGVCAFPFRSLGMEEELNRFDAPLEIRIDRAVRRLPAPVLDDIQGSADYREFVLRNTLYEIVKTLEGA